MLTQVSIDKQKENTCVEELGNEYHIGNRCELFTESIMSNPLDKFDDEHLQNGVHSDDEEGNTRSQNVRDE